MAKWSRFNFVVKEKDSSGLLFNARTGALIRLNASRMSEVDSSEELDDEFFTLLFQQGFIVADDVNEVHLVARRYEEARQNKSSLSVTLELTETCNFRCIYCYQAHANESLTGDSENKVLRYLERKMEHLEHLHINWFGGEPLLRLKTLDRLSRQIAQHAITNSCRLTQYITTNGYLITHDVANKLREIGITSVQITLDGSESIHNRSRPLASGRGTYNRVLDACREVVDQGIELMVRVNLTKINYRSIKELLRDLVRKGVTPDKTIIHIVRAVDHFRSGGGDSSIFFRNAEFAQKWAQCLDTVASFGFGAPSTDPIAYNCPFDLKQAVMVGRDGCLRHCSSSNAPIAEIDTAGELTSINGIYERVKNRRPLDDPECRNCRYLPLCMGGCSYLQEIGEEKCCPERYILPHLLKLTAQQSLM